MYLEESLQEVGGPVLCPVKALLLEVRHDVGGLAPEVHGFLYQAASALPLLLSFLIPSASSAGCPAYLIVGMAPEDEDVHRRELVDESVALKLLPDASSDGGDGEGDRVHGLDLGGLDGRRTSRVSPTASHPRPSHPINLSL